ncbi:MAG: hypothetical protein AAFW00_19670 [Bacteroidota bacterium]
MDALRKALNLYISGYETYIIKLKETRTRLKRAEEFFTLHSDKGIRISGLQVIQELKATLDEQSEAISRIERAANLEFEYARSAEPILKNINYWLKWKGITYEELALQVDELKAKREQIRRSSWKGQIWTLDKVKKPERGEEILFHPSVGDVIFPYEEMQQAKIISIDGHRVTLYAMNKNRRITRKNVAHVLEVFRPDLPPETKPSHFQQAWWTRSSGPKLSEALHSSYMINMKMYKAS